MALVSWNGTIMDEGDGVVDFTPGARQRGWQVSPLLRSDGDTAKKMGIAGCLHVVDMKFLHVLNVENLIEALTDFTTSDEAGTLTVAGHGSYSNCILVTHSFGLVERETYGISLVGGVLTSSTRYTVPVSFTFHQLR